MVIVTPVTGAPAVGQFWANHGVPSSAGLIPCIHRAFSFPDFISPTASSAKACDCPSFLCHAIPCAARGIIRTHRRSDLTQLPPVDAARSNTAGEQAVFVLPVVTPTTMPAAIITGAAIVGIGRTVHSSISVTVVSRGISAIVGGGITAAVV